MDVHNRIIEKKEEVKKNIKKALEVFPIEKVWIDPDCGLKTRTPQEAEEKLKVMVSAVKELKEKLGIERSTDSAD